MRRTEPPRSAAPAATSDERARLRPAVLARKLEVLLGLRRDGAVDEAMARKIQRRLDIE